MMLALFGNSYYLLTDIFAFIAQFVKVQADQFFQNTRLTGCLSVGFQAALAYLFIEC